MRAGIYMGRRHIQVKEIPVPQVGDNDVLIQNIYSSICGTDVAVYQKGPDTGHKIAVGGEFGHETVSRVCAIGKNVTEFQIGQRVYPYPRFVKRDTKRAGTIGGFSEYILVENAKLNHSLYLVPEKISDRCASLIEPFTVGCRAARRGMPKPGQNAVVFGCGTIGLAAAIALQYFGVDKVLVTDISDFRLSVAKKLGFVTANMQSGQFERTAYEYFGKASGLQGATYNADIFVDAAGAESILELFMQQGKIESRFVSVAVNNALRQLDLLHLTYAQKSIIGSGGYMPEDVRDVFEIMLSRGFKIEEMITHEFPIEQLEAAVEMASDAGQAFNVVIHF